jgi:hypothetical protein
MPASDYSRKYLVLDETTTEDLGGLPTIRLADEGRGEAYFIPAERRPDLGGVWYLRDDERGYVSPTGEYRRVRIVLNLKYQGW